jgi:hypothetical protein
MNVVVQKTMHILVIEYVIVKMCDGVCVFVNEDMRIGMKASLRIGVKAGVRIGVIPGVRIGMLTCMRIHVKPRMPIEVAADMRIHVVANMRVGVFANMPIKVLSDHHLLLYPQNYAGDVIDVDDLLVPANRSGNGPCREEGQTGGCDPCAQVLGGGRPKGDRCLWGTHDDVGVAVGLHPNPRVTARRKRRSEIYLGIPRRYGDYE